MTSPASASEVSLDSIQGIFLQEKTLGTHKQTIERLRRVAQHSGASLETVLLEGGEWLYTKDTPDKEAMLKRLDTLSDVQLWTVVYQRLMPQDQARYEELRDHLKQQPLRAIEEAELDHLVALIDYQMLLRSKALLLLKERGYDTENYINSKPDVSF